MGSISSAFSIITGALQADQSALSIVAGNVANANTPGYTQQTPTWKENSPVTINGISYGVGVTQSGATSARDRILLQRLYQQQQLASASGSRLDALNNIQSLFTPDSGSNASGAGNIGSDLTSFFSSFSSLQANPGNNALRQQVLSSASTMAADFAGTAASLNMQKAALEQNVASVVTQVNALAASIAALNQQIQSVSPQGDAGTLEDQRQQDLSQLSQLIGINQITTEGNGLTITTVTGQTLVAGQVSFTLPAQTVNGETRFFTDPADPSTDVTAQYATGGGKLGGYLTARDTDVTSVLSALDKLAYGIATEVNLQNAQGTDLNGSAGSNIFTQPAQVGGSAAHMSVVMTDPGGIAAAAAGAGAGSGDNSNLIAFANLANSSAPAVLVGFIPPGGVALTAGQGLLNNLTPTNFYSGLVTTLGSTVAQVKTENAGQSASVAQLQSQNNALSQVNLNDQAASLATLERSYQAASQVFNILNNIMSSVLNLGVQTAVS